MRALWHASAIALMLCLPACGGEDSPNEPAPPCAFSLSTTALSFGAEGGSSSLTISTAAGCAWSARSDRDWLTVVGGASGTGNGAVSVSVAANTSTDSRSATLTVADKAVRVDESGLASCTTDLSPTEASFGEDPRTGTFEVRTLAHCRWTAATSDNWITITSAREGAGNAVLAYAVDRNRDATARTGRISVNERQFVITQTARVLDCEYLVGPVTLDACMSVPFDLTTTVTTGPGCTWTVAPDAGWINLTSNSSGIGSGVVTFRVADNYDAPRSGIVMVRWPTITAGQNVRVNQAGCRYGTSVTEIAIAGAGGVGSFDVLQQSDPLTCGGALQDRCVWSAQTDAPWITITTSMPRMGDDRVSFTVAANEGPTPRTATITVRDRTVRVTQGSR